MHPDSTTRCRVRFAWLTAPVVPNRSITAHYPPNVACLDLALQRPAETSDIAPVLADKPDQVRFGRLDQATTYEAAVECATRDLATDPNCHLAYETLSYARLFQRRHHEALLAGEKAIALGPNGSIAYHIAGMVHGYAADFRKYWAGRGNMENRQQTKS